MSATKILLTGATGYIGGTVLDHLLKSTHPAIVSAEISLLMRDDPRADQFSTEPRIARVHKLQNFEDVDAISNAARENDIVISCATGYHPAFARALVHGLGVRQRQLKDTEQSRHRVCYIHTDGTSNLADKPITKQFHEERTFSDKDKDICDYLRERNKTDPYAQRTTALSVVDAGLEELVPTVIIMSPTIFGLGSGRFNKLTIQYPAMMRGALKHKRAAYVGDGQGQWDYVHVQDLAVLYELVLLDRLSGENVLPTGKQGIMFSETGNFRWKDVAAGIGRAGSTLGALRTDVPESISLSEASERWGVSEQLCELGLASNSRTKSEVAREILGWRPTKTHQDWESTFVEEFGEILRDPELKTYI